MVLLHICYIKAMKKFMRQSLMVLTGIERIILLLGVIWCGYGVEGHCGFRNKFHFYFSNFPAVSKC